MASIFDMFGGSPQSQGLLAATAQILQGSGPSFRPTGLGQILGGGLQAYQQTEQQAREQGQLQQMRGLQIQGAESDLEAKKLARQRAQEYQALVKSYQLTRGVGQQAPAALPQDRSGAAMFAGLMDGSARTASAPGEQQAMAAPGAQPRDRNALVQERLQFAQYLRDNGYQGEAQAAEESALKLQPKVKEWSKVTAGGKTMYAPFFEDGTHGQPVPLQVAQALERVNLGGTTALIDPTTGETVRSLTNTVDPNTRANNAVSIRGQDMTDQRAREANDVNRLGQRTQIVTDPLNGPMLVDKGTGQARQVMMNGQAVPGETAAKKVAAAKNLMPLIEKAGSLIDGATGSYLGAGADQVARWYGSATDGAQNIAQLRVLEGNIMMAQPRMEGPQSNMDVELYRQMAAQIGDPTVPKATKKAALTVLKSMYEKYAPEQAAPASGGGVKFLGFE
ncbi:hypothetical protein SOM61_08440 [Massilia sp. CFBP9012]|uniref:hypothetical protein n=1 Tax=Massilia sp. CFBP9012 TaxID=3096531 RepID=UPI002A6A34CF|nr:hypothetical protein [Massilia sp. CFBP9012]MDY0974988.1 hypothetical protein [Massilia sp. CFBP9012]